MANVFGTRAGGPASRDRFIGETGLVFESLHLPRIAGQIFGALLLAPSEGYTANELVEMLQVSKGSVSGMTRLLMHYDMVSRVSLPGDRRDRFVIKPGASAEMMIGRMELLGQLQKVAIDGLRLLGPDGDPGPLTEVRDLYAFLQRELPRLLERWERERFAGAGAHESAGRATGGTVEKNGRQSVLASREEARE